MKARESVTVRAAGERLGLMLVLAALLASGCSFKKMTVNMVGDALAQSGSTFAADDDPELVRQAVPFSLKLMESLLAESPRHVGLLQACAQGFTQYAYGFVQQDADEVEDQDFGRAEAIRRRARKLYLRARGYGLRALEVRHRGFQQALRQDPPAAVRNTRREDVPLLYWTAAAWGAAIAISKDQPGLIADQNLVAALIDRALELDEGFDRGSVHTFLITFEMARPGVTGDPVVRARQHFERALELSQGQLAAPLLSYAESVCVPGQNRAEFESLLRQALALDADAVPAVRLVNLIMQRRARWLLGRTDDLFFEANAK